ncbi:hypothetical protein BLOT_016551 [Blomia tropicalis]|nr:hypothetical protein BLOT_016551 [Blomia tropicalis]
MQNSYRKLLFYISGIVFFSCILGYIVFNVYMIATVSKKSREQIVPYARRKLILLFFNIKRDQVQSSIKN